MPRSLIHTWSVTSCRPRAARSKSAIAQIDQAKVASAPSSVTARPAMPGSSRPSSAAAAGSQRGMERGRLTRSLGLQEEVEDHQAGAEQQQRGVGAQEARLQRPDGGRAGAHDARRAAHQRPVYEDALERLLGEAARPGEGRDDAGADELVEVPLVDEEPVGARQALLQARGDLAIRAAPDGVGDEKAPAAG